MSSRRLSIQLYTLREALADDLGAVLRRLAGMGFAHVEPYRFMEYAPQLAASFAETGLTAPTAHARLVGEDQEAVFTSAARLGIGTVIDPRVPDERWETEEDIRSIADDLNDAARRAADHGLRVGYHNHAREIATRFGDRTALEVLAEHLDPAVGIELDAYWAAVAGADPVALVSAFGARLVAVHVKDGPATDDPADQVAVGAGGLPIREIVEAAPRGALLVIELDDSRHELFSAVADSRRFLVEEGLA